MKPRVGCSLFALVFATAGNAQCLKYPPDTATVTGVVHLKTFFGPPGYGEDPAHDRKETQALLTLDEALCIDRGHDDGLEEPETNQHLVTLVPLGKSVNFRAF